MTRAWDRCSALRITRKNPLSTTSAPMKAIIPLAGRGTRLRPHTHFTPKPLMRVAGRPVMSYILDSLVKIGVDEVVFVVGYLRDAIAVYVAQAYPHITAHHVVQEVQDGTAGAVALAEPFVDEGVLILFVDTLFDADLTVIRDIDQTTGGIIWAKEVEDYGRYGVVVTDENRHLVRIVEKPTEPVSRLATIGLYYVADWKLLFEGISHTLGSTAGPSGEFYLTDAFQYMADQGAKIRVASVESWYDCGRPAALLQANQHLLGRGRAGVDDAATIEGSKLIEPVRVEGGALVSGSTLGPNVTVESGARIEGSTIVNTIVGRDAYIDRSNVQESLVGSCATVRTYCGRLNVVDHSEVIGCS